MIVRRRRRLRSGKRGKKRRRRRRRARRDRRLMRSGSASCDEEAEREECYVCPPSVLMLLCLCVGRDVFLQPKVVDR